MLVVIFAGGSGEGLWPVSRRDLPKQFMTIEDEKSFFYKTVKRSIQIAGKKNVYALTIDRYFFKVKSVLESFGIGENNIIVEPFSRNTGIALIYALKWLESKKGKSLSSKVLFCPSDSHIERNNLFKKGIVGFSKRLKKGEIIVFGAKPVMPLRNYGYIKLGKKVSNDLYEIMKFVRNPSSKRAGMISKSPNWLWNTGFFVSDIETLKLLFEKNHKRIFNRFNSFDLNNKNLLKKTYKNIKPISADDVLFNGLKNSRIFVAKPGFNHLDINDWEVFYKTCNKDKNGNVLIGDVLSVDSKDSLILSEKHLVVCSGLKDASVIACDDVVYVGRTNDSKGVEKILKILKSRKRKETCERTTTYRPWGKYTVLEESDNYKIKRIVVYPGESLSLQMHNYRSEHWVVIKGKATVRIGDKKRLLNVGESTFVPLKALHQLQNFEKENLEIIEVQMGDYVGEDDIIRFEDKYGRKTDN